MSFDTSSLQSLSPHSRESSTDLSPTSRPSSQSPTSMSASMSSRPAAVTVMEPNAWNESMIMNNQSHQTQPQQHSDLVEPSNSPYHLSAMPAQAVSPKQYISYDNPIPSSSRQLSSDVYLSSPNAYTQSLDRPIDSNYGNQKFSPRREFREDIRQQYVYTHPYQHDLNMRSQSPSSSPISQSHPLTSARFDYTLFSQTIFTGPPRVFNRPEFLPNPVQLQHNPRPPEHHRQPLADHIHVSTNPNTAHYGQDGRFNPVP